MWMDNPLCCLLQKQQKKHLESVFKIDFLYEKVYCIFTWKTLHKMFNTNILD